MPSTRRCEASRLPHVNPPGAIRNLSRRGEIALFVMIMLALGCLHAAAQANAPLQLKRGQVTHFSRSMGDGPPLRRPRGGWLFRPGLCDGRGSSRSGSVAISRRQGRTGGHVRPGPDRRRQGGTGARRGDIRHGRVRPTREKVPDPGASTPEHGEDPGAISSGSESLHSRNQPVHG